jgi:hypothetical protein
MMAITSLQIKHITLFPCSFIKKLPSQETMNFLHSLSTMHLFERNHMHAHTCMRAHTHMLTLTHTNVCAHAHAHTHTSTKNSKTIVITAVILRTDGRTVGLKLLWRHHVMCGKDGRPELMANVCTVIQYCCFQLGPWETSKAAIDTLLSHNST